MPRDCCQCGHRDWAQAPASRPESSLPSADHPKLRNRCSASSSKMPFFATIPMTIIMPIREATLNVVPVTSNARKPPNAGQQRADPKIAVGAEKVPELQRAASTANNSNSATSRTIIRSRDDFLSLFIQAAHTPLGWTRVNAYHSPLFCTAATPLPMSTPSNPRRHLDETLQILSTNFRFAWIVDHLRQGTKRRRSSRGAG